jgi:hypothetical protein
MLAMWLGMSALAVDMQVDMAMVVDGVQQHMVLAGVVAMDMAMVVDGEVNGLVPAIMAFLKQFITHHQ